MTKSQSSEWFDNKKPVRKEEFTEASKLRAQMKFLYVYNRMQKK